MEQRICGRGHKKVLRTYGWNCDVCSKENYHARREKAVAEGLMPRPVPKGTSKSIPTDKICDRGHQRVMRPNGEIACPTCVNMWRRGRRRLANSGECPHIAGPAFSGVINNHGDLVCLDCVVANANAKKAASIR